MESMSVRLLSPIRLDQAMKYYQPEAYVSGVMVADWGKMPLYLAIICARDLKREFPEAIVAIMPARY